MGSGKSSVGAELARLTGWTHVDMDSEIERAAAMSVAGIFERLGEEKFRDMETAEILKLPGRAELIISTGGGAVMRDRNIEALRAAGTVVYLRATVETILERVGGDAARPLINADGPGPGPAELLAKRAPRYETAELTVDTDSITPLGAAEEILRRLKWKG